jgi:hypothetical protein
MHWGVCLAHAAVGLCGHRAATIPANFLLGMFRGQIEDFRRRILHASYADNPTQQCGWLVYLVSPAVDVKCPSTRCLLGVQLIHDGTLLENGIIRLDEYVCNVVQERK